MSGSVSVSARGGREAARAARRPLGLRRSDERLARLVARDGQEPFAELYERYHQPLYRYCRSIVRDEHDAQDALQSAMAGAFAALRKGEREIAVRPWLFRIAHNEAVSLLRRRRPYELAADELEIPAPAHVAEPGQVLEQRERLATLLSDLRGLTSRQRSVLLMRELSGLSIGEIAAACGSSEGAVKQALFEAREALREKERGRAMDCEQARRLIGEDDRRALRGRRLASHLRSCESCRELADVIAARRQDLRLLAPPLPAAAAAALLSHLLGTGTAVSGAAAAGASAGASSAAQGATSGSTGAAGAGAMGGGAASTGAAGGAAGTGVGSGAASGLSTSIAAHTGGAIAAKLLTAAAVVAVGTASVAGVASVVKSGSHVSAPGAARHGSSAPHGAADERREAGGAAAGDRSAAGDGAALAHGDGPAAGGAGAIAPTSASKSKRAAFSAGGLGHGLARGDDHQAQARADRGEAGEPPGGSAGSRETHRHALGRGAKEGHGLQVGRGVRPRHESEESGSSRHRSHSSRRGAERGGGQRRAAGNAKGTAGNRRGDGERSQTGGSSGAGAGKQAAGGEGGGKQAPGGESRSRRSAVVTAPTEDESVSGEAPSSEHAKGTQKP